MDFRHDDGFKFKDVKIQRVNDNVTVVGYNVPEDLRVEGKPFGL